tara:strand:- start:8094 stop:9704 length:1611 start_codon:yes stop_codon:yes gene_type:complete
MSDWSSFNNDKKHMDSWRKFLSEDKNKGDKEQLNEVSFLQSLGLQKMDPEENKKIDDLAKYILDNPKYVDGLLDRKTGRVKLGARMGGGLAVKMFQMLGVPYNDYNLLRVFEKLMSMADPEGATVDDFVAAQAGARPRLDRLMPALKRASKQIKQKIEKEFEENPENFESPDLGSLSQYEKDKPDEEAEEEAPAASADPDTAEPETGQASVRVGQTTRNLAGHLMTMDQARFIQAMVIRALNQAGYGKSIRMDESTKLLKQFLTDPAVLLKELLIADIITEITATGRGYDPAPRRTPARPSRALAPIDLGGAGIKPENQRKVKRILDKMLSGVGLEVEFGPTKPDPRFADRTPEPEAPAAAEPRAAGGFTDEPDPAASWASDAGPPMGDLPTLDDTPEAPEAAAEPEAPAAEPEAAAAEPEAAAAAAAPEAAAAKPAAPGQDVKISTSSKYGAKATTIEDLALQMLGMPRVPDPNKQKNQNRAFTKLTNKIAQAMKKALQDEFGTSLGKVTIYENNQAKIEKLFIEEFQRVLNEKK